VTWNLHGSGGVDIGAVADHLARTGAELVVLQEVDRAQAAALAAALGGTTAATWCFKHRGHPLRQAEGMAVLDLDDPGRASCRGITARWRWWSWRRRIIQLAAVEVDGLAVTLVHVHLSPHPSGAAARRRESALVVAAAGPSILAGTCIVAGDLNEGPGGSGFDHLLSHGLQDGWEAAAERRGAGPTNWSSAHAALPDQRLDHVLCGHALQVERAEVPDLDGSGPDWRSLSDHLPFSITLRRTPTTPTAADR
jgi:endonuclease/exonuclease/phosphatase family metal-dependent hydrolase